MAYDVKMLLSNLKDEGLDLAEDTAKIVVKGVLEWLVESAAMSENKYDDMLVAIIPLVEDHVMDLLDKIDGEDD